MVQVDLKKVVEHVCDTAGHLLKPRVTLEKMVDQSTPLIAGDGSRIVQVCAGKASPSLSLLLSKQDDRFNQRILSLNVCQIALVVLHSWILFR